VEEQAGNTVRQQQTQNPRPCLAFYTGQGAHALTSGYFYVRDFAQAVWRVVAPARYALLADNHQLVDVPQPRPGAHWSPQGLVAARPYNPLWPTELQSLYRACLLAHGAQASWLDMEASDVPELRDFATPQAHMALECSQGLNLAWHALERYAGPLFDSWDHANPDFALGYDFQLAGARMERDQQQQNLKTRLQLQQLVEGE